MADHLDLTLVPITEKEAMTRTDINPIVIAGTTEIADHFGVRTNVVGNWISRYRDFPEPIAELAMGRAWDLNEVVEWYNDRWATDVGEEGVPHA